MVIRLFSNPWLYKETNLKSDDLNDSFSKVLDIAGLTAESNYKILAASLSFENEDSSAVEDYTSAGGANSTVNIGSTTALWNTDHYKLNLTTSSDVSDAHGVTIDSLTTNSNDNGVRIQANSTKVLKSVTKTGFSNTTRALLKSDTGNSILAIATFSGNVATFSDYPLLESGTYYRIECDADGASVQNAFKADVPFSGTNIDYISGSVNGINNTDYFNVFSIITSDFTYDSTSVIISDSNTLAVDNETNAFCLYVPSTIPTNTSIDIDLSDGTNTINLLVNSVTKKTDVIAKDTLTTITDIEITTNLNTTDTSVTPEAKGWSIVKL